MGLKADIICLVFYAPDWEEKSFAKEKNCEQGIKIQKSIINFIIERFWYYLSRWVGKTILVTQIILSSMDVSFPFKKDNNKNKFTSIDVNTQKTTKTSNDVGPKYNQDNAPILFIRCH